MSESEPLLSEHEEVKQKMHALRLAAQSRKVNAYVDYLAEKRRLIDEQMNRCTILLVVLSFFSILFSVMILEISWHSGAYHHDNFGIEFCKFVVSILTVATVGVLWWKYQLLAQNVAPDQATLAAAGKSNIHTPKKKKQEEGKSEKNSLASENQALEGNSWIYYQSPLTFLVEVIFSSMHCTILVHPIYASLTLFRAYHFLGLMRFIPFIKKLRTRQIESGHKASQTYWAIIKIWLRFHPWLSVLLFVVLFLPILSYSVYAVERSDEESDIHDYMTALWLTTWMLFVGEAYQPSFAGRIPALMCGMSSVVVATLVFVGLQRTLEYDAQDEAIVTGILERQLQEQVRKAAAKYVWIFWRSYKRNKNYVEDSVKLELRKRKKEWQAAKRNLRRAQKQRPAGAASVVVQIEELVQETAKIVDNFRMSTLGKLNEMGKQCGKIETGKLDADKKNEREIERLLQTYRIVQDKSTDDMKQVTQMMEEFRRNTQSNVKQIHSRNVNFQSEALDNLKDVSLKMEKQFKALIDKQASQAADLKQAKLAAEASKEMQKKQMDICEGLRNKIKELGEMQQTMIASNLQTHSEKVIDKINTEMRSPTNSGFFQGKKRGRSQSKNRTN